LSADLDDGRVVGFLRNQTAVAALTLSGNKCVVAVTAVGPPALSGALGAGRNSASAQLPGLGFTVVACGETSMIVRLEGKVEMETAPGWHTSQPIRGNTYFSVTAPGTAPLSDEQLAASMN
jgi:hypothetical protein